MRRAAIIAVVAAAAGAIAIGVLQSGGSDTDAGVELVGREAAQARLRGAPPRLAAIHRQSTQLLDGGPRAFERRVAQLRGLPIVVNAWGSWCVPCRQEMPIFNRLSARLGRRVAFLGIDVQDSAAGARAFMRRIPVSYPSYSDPSERIANGLGLRNLPSTVFYDRRGRATLHQGVYRSEAELEQDIRRYALGG